MRFEGMRGALPVRVALQAWRTCERGLHGVGWNIRAEDAVAIAAASYDVGGPHLLDKLALLVGPDLLLLVCGRKEDVHVHGG